MNEPRDLQWQIVLADEKRTRAIIARAFSSSQMNTTKWRELADSLSGLAVKRWVKFVDVDYVQPVGEFWYSHKDWFDCGAFGPFSSVSIEYLEIARTEIQHRGALLAPVNVDHTDEIAKRLGAKAIPFEVYPDRIRVTGHVRKS
ncbi:MAG TPA: DUF6678 family protein [Capsulimonadaceae bacterium]|jgi:hypothetical protein